MEHSLERSGEVSVLVLKGALTIEYASDLCLALLEAVEGATAVSLDCEEVSAVDLSSVQLMCSLHRLATDMGKTVSFVGTIPETLRTVVTRAGFERQTVCDEKYGDGCFWASVFNEEQ